MHRPVEIDRSPITVIQTEDVVTAVEPHDKTKANHADEEQEDGEPDCSVALLLTGVAIRQLPGRAQRRGGVCGTTTALRTLLLRAAPGLLLLAVTASILLVPTVLRIVVATHGALCLHAATHRVVVWLRLLSTPAVGLLLLRTDIALRLLLLLPVTTGLPGGWVLLWLLPRVCLLGSLHSTPRHFLLHPIVLYVSTN